MHASQPTTHCLGVRGLNVPGADCADACAVAEAVARSRSRTALSCSDACSDVASGEGARSARWKRQTESLCIPLSSTIATDRKGSAPARAGSAMRCHPFGAVVLLPGTMVLEPPRVRDDRRVPFRGVNHPDTCFAIGVSCNGASSWEAHAWFTPLSAGRWGFLGAALVRPRRPEEPGDSPQGENPMRCRRPV